MEAKAIYKINGTAILPDPPENFPVGWMEAHGGAAEGTHTVSGVVSELNRAGAIMRAVNEAGYIGGQLQQWLKRLPTTGLELSKEDAQHFAAALGVLATLDTAYKESDYGIPF